MTKGGGLSLMEHIWMIEDWEKNIDFNDENRKTGLRLRFDKDIDPEVRRVYGTFTWWEDDYEIPPYIRVAAGDYQDKCKRWGKDSALTAILLTIAHELTHYFQWINSLTLTSIGRERQATKYARYVLDDYAETREHP